MTPNALEVTDSDWQDAHESSQKIALRRRFRRWIVWTYIIGLAAASLTFATRGWDVSRLEWVLKWSLLFMTPGGLAWFLQMMRRRWAVIDAGELIARFPPQRVGTVPAWLYGFGYLLSASLPFSILFFRDGHLLLLVMVASAGLLLFAIAWLWFDGVPVECRANGLVVDGTRWIAWAEIVGLEETKRSNKHLLHYREPKNFRHRDQESVSDSSTAQGSSATIGLETHLLRDRVLVETSSDERRDVMRESETLGLDRHASQRPTPPPQKKRTFPIFVAAEDYAEFLQCIMQLTKQTGQQAILFRS